MSEQGRVKLRRAEQADIDTILVWLEDRTFIEFLLGDSATARTHLREKLVALFSQGASVLAGTSFYLIHHDGQGLIGVVTIQNLAWRNRLCRFDLHVVETVRSVDMERACLHAVFRHVFGEMNLHRVTREVRASQTTAIELLEEAGATREAVLRGHALVNGRPEDVYAYGMLQTEYRGFDNASATHAAQGG